MISMDFNNEKVINNIDIMVLISSISYLSIDDKNKVLSLPLVRERIKKDLLLRCLKGDVYGNFRKIISLLGVDNFISIFDYSSIHDTFKILGRDDFTGYNNDYKLENYAKIDDEINMSIHRNSNEYKLFVCLVEESPDKVLEWILNDDNLFKEYINISDNMYSMVSMFSYDLIVKLIYKLEEFGFGTGNVSFNFSSVNFEDKIRLLEEGFSDETIIKLIDDFDVNAKSHFFLNDKRAIYLYKKVNGFTNLIRSGVRFSRDILLQNDFFDKLKHSNFSEFRRNINAVEKYNDPLIIQSKLSKYYDELINEYDKDRGIFKYYGNVFDNPNLLKENKRDDFIFNFDVRYVFASYIDYNDDGTYNFGDIEEQDETAEGNYDFGSLDNIESISLLSDDEDFGELPEDEPTVVVDGANYDFDEFAMLYTADYDIDDGKTINEKGQAIYDDFIFVPSTDDGVYNFGDIDEQDETAKGDYDFGDLDEGVDIDTVAADDYDFNVLAGDATEEQFIPGTEYNLDNVPLYANYCSTTSTTEISGIYYIYNSKIANNRIRVCKYDSGIEVPCRYSGWVNIEDLANSNEISVGDLIEVTGKMYRYANGYGGYTEYEKEVFYVTEIVTNGDNEFDYTYPYGISKSPRGSRLGFVDKDSIKILANNY